MLCGLDKDLLMVQKGENIPKKDKKNTDFETIRTRAFADILSKETKLKTDDLGEDWLDCLFFSGVFIVSIIFRELVLCAFLYTMLYW